MRQADAPVGREETALAIGTAMRDRCVHAREQFTLECAGVARDAAHEVGQPNARRRSPIWRPAWEAGRATRAPHATFRAVPRAYSGARSQGCVRACGASALRRRRA